MSTGRQAKRKVATFTIRGLLLLMLVCCVVFAWVGHRMATTREERQALRKILVAGGSVQFSFGGQKNGDWLMRTLGPGSVRLVYLDNTDFSDLETLRPLKIIRYLHLANTPVRDITPLADYHNLWGVDLSGTHVVDVSPLKSIPNLNFIRIANTNVRDITPLLERDPSRIISLDLSNTLVPAQDIDLLRKNFPDWEIIHNTSMPTKAAWTNENAP